MFEINILDSTLRDGGYANNWCFDLKTSKSIISALYFSKIDFIEVGFLSDERNFTDKTKFNLLSDINQIVGDNIDLSKLYVMIKYSDYDIFNLPNANKTLIKNIRLIFKKHQCNYALKYARILIDKGYNVFLNPTFYANYSKYELELLIAKVNTLMPHGFTLVDSTGSLDSINIDKNFELLNKEINGKIALGFHFHDNLNNAFSNAKILVKKKLSRNLFIDSTLMGIGRGAGNLSTECISQYLNTHCNKNYNTDLISQISNSCIKSIYNNTSNLNKTWYYFSAVNKCHPDYAKYLSKYKHLSTDKLNAIFKAIPANKKDVYDKDCISTLFSLMTK